MLRFSSGALLNIFIASLVFFTYGNFAFPNGATSFDIIFVAGTYSANVLLVPFNSLAPAFAGIDAMGISVIAFNPISIVVPKGFCWKPICVCFNAFGAE